MGEQFDDLMEAMPSIAKAVNGFENEAAQQRALDALLGAFFGQEYESDDEESDDGDDESSAGRRDTPPPGGRGRPKWEQKFWDAVPEDHIIVESKRDQQAVWAVGVLHERGEEATTESVRQTIKDRLGIQPQSTDNTSSTLSSLNPRYLGREKRSEGHGYAYHLKPDSRKIFGEN